VRLRPWFAVTIRLGALALSFQAATSLAQQDPTTADQVIAKYMEAVGADRSPSITTFMERGEVDRNSRFPGHSNDRERGTFAFYYKSPNLRFGSELTDKRRVIALHACDGKVTWYIGPDLKRTELKPKPGSEYDCEEGYRPWLFRLREPKAKIRLLGKKALAGRMVWEIKANVPGSPGTETHYFDAETFLLLRSAKDEFTTTYSDYRDVGGIKIPFTTTTTREPTDFKRITTVREIEINSPIDDGRFAELEVKDGLIWPDHGTSTKKDDAETSNGSSEKSLSSNAKTSNTSPEKAPPASTSPTAASVVVVNFPNFTSCTIAELQLAVPELKGLKPAADQEKLASLLDRVGDKTVEIARNTPNLISRETVTQAQGTHETRRDYDYLLLPQLEGTVVSLDEFRVDLKSGEKFQTDEIIKKDSSVLADLERASREIAMSESGPASQGFAASWVHFYPRNRSRATFRYLGEQEMDGQRTIVLAFAQNPASVLTPAIFRYQGKIVPTYLQGVAWVDPSDFRILRLRTDLLAPLPEVTLDQLTADIKFGLTRIETVPSPLELPREVAVTCIVGGSTLHEIHKYSEYRLFRAQSKILLHP
jgi:hypothetical protein